MILLYKIRHPLKYNFHHQTEDPTCLIHSISTSENIQEFGGINSRCVVNSLLSVVIFLSAITQDKTESFNTIVLFHIYSIALFNKVMYNGEELRIITLSDFETFISLSNIFHSIANF